MCVCVSIRPGSRVRSPRSITRAPAGRSVPTASIDSPRTTTTARFRYRPLFTSRRRDAFTAIRGASGGGAAARGAHGSVASAAKTSAVFTIVSRILSKLSSVTQAALVSAAEVVEPVVLGVEVAQVVRCLLVSAAPNAGTHRLFETAPVRRFGVREAGAVALVIGPLGVADADPPALARRIQAFRSLRVERGAGAFRLVLVDQREDDRMAPSQSVFVEVELVLRQPAGDLLVERSAGSRAAGHPAGGQERRPEELGCGQRPETGDE